MSLAGPLHDVKVLEQEDEEDARKEVNVLLLGDVVDGQDLRSNLLERYMEFARSQKSIHIKSDTHTTKSLDLDSDNRPVLVRITTYDTKELDPLTLSKTSVAIVLFSVAVPYTLDNALTKWIPTVRKLNNSPSLPIILVGTQVALRRQQPSSLPQNLVQGFAFAHTNRCHSYFELSDFSDALEVGQIFEEALASVLSPVLEKEASIFLDSIKGDTNTKLDLAHKNLTTGALSCLASTDERKANLAKIKSLVLSHNALTHLPHFVYYDMPQLEELRVDNNHLADLDRAIGQRLPKLRILDLRYNELPSLPSSISKMSLLEQLNLNGNPLEDEALLSPSVSFIRSYLANPLEWTERGVLLWLERCKMSKYKQAFFENDIDGEVLLSLEGSELREYLGVAEQDVPLLLSGIATLAASASRPPVD